VPSVTGWSWFDVLSNQAAEVAGQFTDPAARNAVSGVCSKLGAAGATLTTPTAARRQEWLNHP
jgi:hypothetical protein